MTCLLSLSNELLAVVAGLAEPFAVLPFALTCKRLLLSTGDVLVKHQNYHRRYAAVHDRHPLAILTILRNGRKDPDVFWHIRQIDYWEHRGSWGCWTDDRMSFSHSHAYCSEIWDRDGFFGTWTGRDLWSALEKRLLNYSELDNSIHTVEERNWIHSVLRNQLQLSSTQVDHWLQMFDDGDDETIKAVLVSQCPRLRTTAFLMSWSDHLFTIYSQSIRNILANKALGLPTRWPPGFRAIERLSLGEISRVGDRPGDYQYSFTAGEVTPFFLLPNIRDIRTTHYVPSEAIDEPWDLGEPSLTLKRLEQEGRVNCRDILKNCPNLEELLTPGDELIKFDDIPETLGRSLKLLDLRHHYPKPCLDQLSACLPRLPQLETLAFEYSSLFSWLWKIGDTIDLLNCLPGKLRRLLIRGHPMFHPSKTPRGGPDKEFVRPAYECMFQMLEDVIRGKQTALPQLESICWIAFCNHDCYIPDFKSAEGSPLAASITQLGSELSVSVHLSDEHVAECETERVYLPSKTYMRKEVNLKSFPLYKEDPIILEKAAVDMTEEQFADHFAKKYRVEYADYVWNGPDGC